MISWRCKHERDGVMTGMDMEHERRRYGIDTPNLFFQYDGRFPFFGPRPVCTILRDGGRTMRACVSKHRLLGANWLAR